MTHEFRLSGGYLVISRENEVVHLHQIEAGETSIGRGKDCTIMLPDPLVSRTHAVVWKNEKTTIIRDLTSRNGTRLDGQPVTEAKLLPGVTIEIGPFHLRVFSDCSEALKAIGSFFDTSTRPSIAMDGQSGSERHLRELTPTQRRVYERFLAGLSEKEIAYLIGIIIHTVHGHAKEIYKIFSVSSRAELLAHSSPNRTPDS